MSLVNSSPCRNHDVCLVRLEAIGVEQDDECCHSSVDRDTARNEPHRNEHSNARANVFGNNGRVPADRTGKLLTRTTRLLAVV